MNMCVCSFAVQSGHMNIDDSVLPPFAALADASARLSSIFVGARSLMAPSAMCMACLYQQQWKCSQRRCNPYQLNCRTLVGKK